MRVGIPRELKDSEYRVSMTPAGVRELTSAGHEVFVERAAGSGSSFPDEDYRRAGATLVEGADETWERAELVCKVKEPIAEEYHRLRDDLVLFTYLHLAASRECTEALLKAGTAAIAYETVQLGDGSLPLLAPMSEVAGRMAPLAGAQFLQRPAGGRGVLMSGVPGVRPAQVVVIGAGVAGMNATAIAAGMHADVAVLDRDLAKLRAADTVYRGQLRTLHSNEHAIEEVCLQADLVIGAVLVDIAVDQGGCFESTRPTTHSEPTYQVHGSIFYCVANMPGAVPHTSTHALTNATLRYTTAIAEHGWKQAARLDPALALGLNTAGGSITNTAVAEAHGMDAVPLADALG